MNDLKKIDAISKTGKEKLLFDGKDLKYNLLDFWRWSVSDILSNATRGRFAEFIVGTAIGLKPENSRDEWSAYDLTTKSGIKIEIKSSAYIQSWNQKKYSEILFSIKPARYWDAETNTQHKEAKRHSDIYVFCLLKHKKQSTINPLEMKQWEFYVSSIFMLDSYKRSQNSITLNSLKKLTKPIGYRDLEKAIKNLKIKETGCKPAPAKKNQLPQKLKKIVLTKITNQFPQDTSKTTINKIFMVL